MPQYIVFEQVDMCGNGVEDVEVGCYWAKLHVGKTNFEFYILNEKLKKEKEK